MASVHACSQRKHGIARARLRQRSARGSSSVQTLQSHSGNLLWHQVLRSHHGLSLISRGTKPQKLSQKRLCSQVSQPVFMLWVNQTSAQELCAFNINLMSAWHCILTKSFLIWSLDSFQELPLPAPCLLLVDKQSKLSMLGRIQSAQGPSTGKVKMYTGCIFYSFLKQSYCQSWVHTGILKTVIAHF